MFFSAAFRPFFLAAACWAVVALVVWLCVLGGGVVLPSRFDPLSWHIHEMLFGFIMAGIAGFLLTAIPNWTNRPPVSGTPLALLFGAWGLGRVACLVSSVLPGWLAVVADLGFPVALATIAARELLASGNRRNYPLLVPITVLGVANLLMHLAALGVALPAGLGWRLGIGCVMALIAVIGGRVTPAFTRNWLRPRGGPAVPEPGRLDRAAILGSVAGLLGWALWPAAGAVGAFLLVVSALHGVRLARWRGAAVAGEPLLLMLHLGYLWMAVALGLLGLSVLTPMVPPAAATHAMTAGAAGSMMLAVMTRATLGHTGRALHADGATVVLYGLVLAGAVLRVVAAWPMDVGFGLLLVSAGCWIGAFTLFAVHYGGMLLTPRRGAEGRTG
jgi:uncharacterized protein involved in response to NO